jgi:hypothetical protein
MASFHVLKDAIDPFDQQLLSTLKNLSHPVRGSAGLVAADHHHHVSAFDFHDGFTSLGMRCDELFLGLRSVV